MSEECPETLAGSPGKGYGNGVFRQAFMAVYGGKQAPEMVTVEAKELVRLLGRGNFMSSMIDLDVGGTAQRAQLSSTVYAAHHIYMALLYNGDPGSGGVLICPLFGGAYSGYDFSSGARNGPQINIGGSDVALCVPYASATPYIQFVNRDPLNTCQASMTVWVQEVVA